MSGQLHDNCLLLVLEASLCNARALDNAVDSPETDGKHSESRWECSELQVISMYATVCKQWHRMLALLWSGAVRRHFPLVFASLRHDLVYEVPTNCSDNDTQRWMRLFWLLVTLQTHCRQDVDEATFAEVRANKSRSQLFLFSMERAVQSALALSNDHVLGMMSLHWLALEAQRLRRHEVARAIAALHVDVDWRQRTLFSLALTDLREAVRDRRTDGEPARRGLDYLATFMETPLKSAAANRRMSESVKEKVGRRLFADRAKRVQALIEQLRAEQQGDGGGAAVHVDAGDGGEVESRGACEAIRLLERVQEWDEFAPPPISATHLPSFFRRRVRDFHVYGSAGLLFAQLGLGDDFNKCFNQAMAYKRQFALPDTPGRVRLQVQFMRAQACFGVQLETYVDAILGFLKFEDEENTGEETQADAVANGDADSADEAGEAEAAPSDTASNDVDSKELLFSLADKNDVDRTEHLLASTDLFDKVSETCVSIALFRAASHSDKEARDAFVARITDRVAKLPIDRSSLSDISELARAAYTAGCVDVCRLLIARVVQHKFVVTAADILIDLHRLYRQCASIDTGVDADDARALLEMARTIDALLDSPWRLHERLRLVEIIVDLGGDAPQLVDILKAIDCESPFGREQLLYAMGVLLRVGHIRAAAHYCYFLVCEERLLSETFDCTDVIERLVALGWLQSASLLARTCLRLYRALKSRNETKPLRERIAAEWARFYMLDKDVPSMSSNRQWCSLVYGVLAERERSTFGTDVTAFDDVSGALFGIVRGLCAANELDTFNDLPQMYRLESFTQRPPLRGAMSVGANLAREEFEAVFFADARAAGLRHVLDTGSEVDALLCSLLDEKIDASDE